MLKHTALVSAVALALVGCGSDDKKKNTNTQLDKTELACLSQDKVTETLLPETEFPGLPKGEKRQVVVSNGCILEGSTHNDIKAKLTANTGTFSIDYPDYALDKDTLKAINKGMKGFKQIDLNTVSTGKDVDNRSTYMYCMRPFSQQAGVEYKGATSGPVLYDVKVNIEEVENAKLSLQFEFDGSTCNELEGKGPAQVTKTHEERSVFKALVLASKNGSDLYDANKDTFKDRRLTLYR